MRIPILSAGELEDLLALVVAVSTPLERSRLAGRLMRQARAQLGWSYPPEKLAEMAVRDADALLAELAKGRH